MALSKNRIEVNLDHFDGKQIGNYSDHLTRHRHLKNMKLKIYQQSVYQRNLPLILPSLKLKVVPIVISIFHHIYSHINTTTDSLRGDATIMVSTK